MCRIQEMDSTHWELCYSQCYLSSFGGALLVFPRLQKSNPSPINLTIILLPQIKIGTVLLPVSIAYRVLEGHY